MKKRLLSLLLTFAMVMSLFAGMTVTANAEELTTAQKVDAVMAIAKEAIQNMTVTNQSENAGDAQTAVNAALQGKGFDDITATAVLSIRGAGQYADVGVAGSAHVTLIVYPTASPFGDDRKTVEFDVPIPALPDADREKINAAVAAILEATATMTATKDTTESEVIGMFNAVLTEKNITGVIVGIENFEVAPLAGYIYGTLIVTCNQKDNRENTDRFGIIIPGPAVELSFIDGGVDYETTFGLLSDGGALPALTTTSVDSGEGSYNVKIVSKTGNWDPITTSVSAAWKIATQVGNNMEFAPATGTVSKDNTYAIEITITGNFTVPASSETPVSVSVNEMEGAGEKIAYVGPFSRFSDGQIVLYVTGAMPGNGGGNGGNGGEGGGNTGSTTGKKIVELKNIISVSGDEITLHFDGGLYIYDGTDFDEEYEEELTDAMIKECKDEFLVNVGKGVVDLSDETLEVADIMDYIQNLKVLATEDESDFLFEDWTMQMDEGVDYLFVVLKVDPDNKRVNFCGDGTNAYAVTGAAVVAIRDGKIVSSSKPVVPSVGGSTGSGTTITVPVSNDKNEVKVDATVAGNDATIKPLDNQQINKIVGDREAAGDVVVDLTGLGKEINTAGIPKESLEAIVDAAEKAGNDTERLVIKLTTAELRLDDTAMRAIVDQANGDVIQFNFDDVGESRLNAAQKNAVKDMDVRKGYEAYITVNGKRVSDFKGGEVEIVVPYEIPAGENKAGFSVWYIDEQGRPEKQKSTYDGKEKCFVVTHFSDYVIVYSEADAQAGNYHICPKDATCPIHEYKDASAAAWYHDGVHYCIDNGIMGGYGKGIFNPNGTVTRQQVWLTLARLSGETPANAAEARAWVMENGISDGTNPTAAVTRQQFITMLYRYAVDMGYDVSVGEDTNILSYSDAFDVAEYAIPAMQWSCGAGIMGGYTDGSLKPATTTTRAHLATFLQRFCVGA